MTCLLVYVSVPESPWAKYTGRVHHCGRCSAHRAYMCVWGSVWEEEEGIFFFVYSLEPIIRPQLRLSDKHIFAACIHTAHWEHVQYVYLQQKSEHDPLWVFSSFLLLSVIKPGINLNLFFFFISISRNYHVMVKLWSWFTNWALLFGGQVSSKVQLLFHLLQSAALGVSWLKPWSPLIQLCCIQTSSLVSF